MMPKINVYLPDDLAEAVKEAGIPVSAVCQRALEQAVRRVTAIRETTLSDLDETALAARLSRFTDRARTVITLSVAQSRAAGSTAVGSGNLLAGIIAEGNNLALRVLHAIEVDTEVISDGLARVPQAEADPATDGQAQRFTTPAANALELAVTEATALGHNYIGCEHLLLGLIAEPDGDAGQVLRALGAELRLTRRAVAAALAGYVHLRAQAAPEPLDTSAVAAAVSAQLQPLLDRIQRLEEWRGAV